MRKIWLLILFLTSGILLFAGDNSIRNFTAKSDWKKISIHWESTSEQDISEYRIERSFNGSEFSEIKTVRANGYSSSYDENDNDAYLKTDLESKNILDRKYTYRLKIVRSSTPTYSDPVDVTHSTSSFRRTWGMIKEMFR